MNDQVQAQPLVKKKSGLPWWAWLVIIVGGGFYVTAILSDVFDSFSTSTTEQTETQQVKTIVSVTAYDLAAAYKSNEVAADEKYKGKTLRITGTIDSIGKDIIDTPYVTLKGEPGDYSMEDVQCMFAEDDIATLSKLSKGTTITIIGTGGDYLTNAQLDNCHIAEK